jgi:hypothetical protein
MASLSSKFRYLLWAASHFAFADKSCPACGEGNTVPVRRKYGVTALYRCPSCEVMFRVPKPSPEKEARFYQRDYQQGFTTDCPAENELTRLMECRFVGTEKDYSAYITALLALGLEPGNSICDFGCSWGYGSWQMSQAGYRVHSWEVSIPRARYAAEKMRCELCTPDMLPEKVDCFFSSHVVEHLTNPRLLWQTARDVLKPGGKIVTFLPNGNPSIEQLNHNYHQLWGQVHPLLLSPVALTRMGELYGFSIRCFSSPYNLREIAGGATGQLTGDELLVVGTLQPR